MQILRAEHFLENNAKSIIVEIIYRGDTLRQKLRKKSSKTFLT